MTLLQSFVEACEKKRYTASSVVDFQHDDVLTLRARRDLALRDLIRAEDLQKQLQKRAEKAAKLTAAKTSSDDSATGTDK